MKHRLKSAFAAVLAAVLLAGRTAWALCPSCLGQSPTVSPTLKLVGLFLLVPPAVFFAVAIVVRRLGRQSAGRGGDQGD